MIIEVVGKEIEKIKGDFESYLNGLNMVGEISYSQYSELYDEGTKQIQKAYELGKSELEKENAELKETLKTYNGCGDWDNDFHTCRVYLQREELQKCVDQLTKAKEIIKNLMKFAEMDDREYEKEYKEAEQFLSEVEK